MSSVWPNSIYNLAVAMGLSSQPCSGVRSITSNLLKHTARRGDMLYIYFDMNANRIKFDTPVFPLVSCWWAERPYRGYRAAIFSGVQKRQWGGEQRQWKGWGHQGTGSSAKWVHHCFYCTLSSVFNLLPVWPALSSHLLGPDALRLWAISTLPAWFPNPSFPSLHCS